MLTTYEDNDGGMLIERSARKPWNRALAAYRKAFLTNPLPG